MQWFRSAISEFDFACRDKNNVSYKLVDRIGRQPYNERRQYIHSAKTNNRWKRDYMLFEEKLKEERKEEYEDGIEQVEINRALRVVDNLLSKGFSIEETCEIAGISAEAYLTAADQD